MAPIHKAARKLNDVAIQREIDAGVSPDLLAEDSFEQTRPKSKFQSLPAEMVSHIVSFGFHCGFY